VTFTYLCALRVSRNVTLRVSCNVTLQRSLGGVFFGFGKLPITRRFDVRLEFGIIDVPRHGEAFVLRHSFFLLFFSEFVCSLIGWSMTYVICIEGVRQR
jgi:hypothetical protein